MEIRVTSDEVIVITQTPDIPIDDVIKVLEKIKECGFIQKPETTVTMAEPKVAVEPAISDGPRGRLPNSYDAESSNSQPVSKNSNIIDLGSLKNVKPVQATYFRCPKCGQSVVTKVKDNVVLRDLETKDVLHLIDPAALDCLIVHGLFDYESAQKCTTESGVYLVGDGELEAHCPMCECHDTIETWVDAFKNPAKYSEFEKPCPICGSETAMFFASDPETKETRTMVTKCENKNCGYILKEGN